LQVLLRKFHNVINAIDRKLYDVHLVIFEGRVVKVIKKLGYFATCHDEKTLGSVKWEN